jgi:hypothetical protein
MKLKVLTRSLHAKLDENRKSLGAKKVSIDQLQLSYENVLYRKAHLNREIQICKDIPTPNLSDVENELGRGLGTICYNENLTKVTESAIVILKEEMDNRIALKRKLDDLQDEYQGVMEVLDKKRKFLEDIPRKVAVLKSAALDLQKQFQQK